MTEKINFTTKEIVWVVERGCYSTRFVDGVFASMDAVRSYYHEDAWQPETGRADVNENSAWHNGKDWDRALSAYPHEVIR